MKQESLCILLTLIVFHFFFYDPEHHVAGMAHSGWRGTVAKIGAKFVAYIQKEYGSKPENIIAAIGPSICRSCYEVGKKLRRI